jgi:uncharacterized membrane protein
MGFGLSGLTWLITCLVGLIVPFVLRSDLPFSIKGFSALLLFLMAVLVFTFEQNEEKFKRESMKND